MKDLFNIFRSNEVVEVDDLADYQVELIDTEDPYPAAMAVTALTLYQLEHGYDRGRFQMIQWALSSRCADVVQVRAMIGLLLICSRQNIKDEWVLEQMAELLSYHNELAYESWYAILTTFKQSVYDPNYAIVKSLYNVPPFTEEPQFYFEPFDRGVVENLDDFEWKISEMFFRTLNVCDSDMYCLMLFLKQFLPAIAKQLKDEDIDIDSLDNIEIKFQQMMMISNGKDHLQPREEELSEIENYVQQLYRFITLSRHTPLRLSENMQQLRHTMIDRMIVVGIDRKSEIDGI